MGEKLLYSSFSPQGERLLYSRFSGGKSYYGGKTAIQHRYVKTFKNEKKNILIPQHMAILKKRKLFYEVLSGQVKCIDMINQYTSIQKDIQSIQPKFPIYLLD